jgi:2-polyprenyl-3-methyl-5-hydroxy-6-metoxy-1,4-benzoquinol methylase
MAATYFPEIFDAQTPEQAREIILTGEGSSTDERWRIETPYVANLIAETIALTTESIVVDYGCGVGRLAKELIARHGCRVVGVDISARMRALAIDYVQSDRFMSCAPEMFDGLLARGFTADAAISVWVLQHCLKPAEDIARIDQALAPHGRLFVLNNIHRAVPTREHAWMSDGIDIRATLGTHFAVMREGKPPEEITPQDLLDIIFWGFYAKRPVRTPG